MRYLVERITPTWDDSFKNFEYVYLPHKDQGMVQQWHQQGYDSKFHLNGAIHDLKNRLPDFVEKFAQQRSWNNVGCAYYRMITGDFLPEHQDHYMAYSQRFDVPANRIWRAIIFLEDWKQGHYFDINRRAIVNWHRGDAVIWNYDVPHSAGNMGTEPRYTLQITGTL